uniref:BEN domain-containing protein 7 n=1 Tax=Anthurium amnicola TaxID=1678845 RepID=A0A1D1XSL3_9ARAE
MNGGGGPSSAVVQLVYSFMDTAYTTTTLGQTCRDSCRHHSSLVTWLAFAMASSSCLAQWVSELGCCSFVTYIGPSSVSSPWYLPSDCLISSHLLWRERHMVCLSDLVRGHSGTGRNSRAPRDFLFS